MVLKLIVPWLQVREERVRIDTVCISVGDKVSPGTKLIEFTSGLDHASMHDCPPITAYRMTSSENAWVRDVRAAEGEAIASGALLALLSTEPDEPLDGSEQRLARNAIAATHKPLDW